MADQRTYITLTGADDFAVVGDAGKSQVRVGFDLTIFGAPDELIRLGEALIEAAARNLSVGGAS
jgi:hypothetical protein